MKYAIVGYPNSLNRGDEIQSLAAANLLPQVDYYIPREEVHTFSIPSDEKVKFICNGWFSQDPYAWPPNNNLDTLLMSFHISDSNNSVEVMTRKALLPFYHSVSPVGCRDYDTLDVLKSIGVDAYFSGCMTLTLNNEYSDKDRTDEVIFLDPFYRYGNESEYINYCMDVMVPPSVRSKAIYLTAENDTPKDSMDLRFEKARVMLNRLARAKLVITSRIHCALPCLAMNTPVYFMDVGYTTTTQRNRFNGIVDLFHTIGNDYFPLSNKTPFYYPLRKLQLYKLIKSKGNLPINWDSPTENKEDYLKLRKQIKENVKLFLERD